MKSIWFGLLLLVLVRVLPAQQPVITPDMAVDTDKLHLWLHSEDPRQIAWAADFARRTHNRAILDEMPTLLESWAMPLSGDGRTSQIYQRMAITAVLDALIQEDVKVSASTIRTVASQFPAQASVLIARLPILESRGLLSDWTRLALGDWNERLLARVASMMLAANPTPQFVAEVLWAAEEELRITIVPRNVGFGGAADSGCGDSLQGKIVPGWPQIFNYDLSENGRYENVLPVISLDDDSIVARRFEQNHPPGSCSFVEALSSKTRHRIIAHWLGVPVNSMSWQPVRQVSIHWTGEAAYQRQLGALVDAERAKLHATVETLREKGLFMSGDTFESTPRLVVTVRCEMIHPCPLK